MIEIGDCNPNAVSDFDLNQNQKLVTFIDDNLAVI